MRTPIPLVHPWIATINRGFVLQRAMLLATRLLNSVFVSLIEQVAAQFGTVGLDKD